MRHQPYAANMRELQESFQPHTKICQLPHRNEIRLQNLRLSSAASVLCENLANAELRIRSASRKAQRLQQAAMGGKVVMPRLLSCTGRQLTAEVGHRFL